MNRTINQLEESEVLELLATSRAGLNGQERQARLDELGKNRLEAVRQFSAIKSLLSQFTNFFSLLLDTAAVLCFIADAVEPEGGMAILGGALLGVSILNALFSFFQEARAERAMEELEKFLPARVTVIEEGRETSIMAESLVPGDLLVLGEGDRVPADARVIKSEGFLVNNAPLTGESRPLSLVATPDDVPLLESENLVFAGASVLRGRAHAAVFATGRRTEFGKIAALSVEIRRPPTPLERETTRMVRTLTIIAVSMGSVFFAYGVASGRSLWVNLVFALGIIVANVPEGLLPTFTLALAVGAVRLAKKKVLVKSLSAVEALGAIQIICTDKTGTLTKNQLAVSGFVPSSEHPASSDRRLGNDQEEAQALLAALRASELRLAPDGDDPSPPPLDGDPLDVALAEAALLRELFAGPAELVRALEDQMLERFPFDVDKRRSAGLCRTEGNLTFSVKGAWEALRPMVTTLAGMEATPERLEAANAAVKALAQRGQRVIAVGSRARGSLDAGMSQEALELDLDLLGFIALEDPLRPEVPAAMKDCRTAGIDVVLITGDHPETAKAIASAAGLLQTETGGERPVVTGAELETMTLEQVEKAYLDGTRVFARTTPAQKMKIVTALKRAERAVAMTGDGVNDAPALKAADVGIAMGLRGTDVAREAAQIVLLDDNFASIARGIAEGRAIFENIRKFTNYVLVSNGPEILPYLLYILLPIPLPLTIIQILVIDLGTDIIPSMALGQEPAEDDVMLRPPRSRNERLLSGRLLAHSYGFLGLIEAGYALSLFFWVLHRGGWSWGRDLDVGDPLYLSATGICLATIMLMQVGNFIGRRSQTKSGLDLGLFRNRLTLAGFALELVGSYCVLFVPQVGQVLGTGPVDPIVYLAALLGPVLIFGADYGRKRIIARFS